MKKTIKQRLIKLLQQGEVSTFNRYRRLTHNTFIDLAGANLTGADLDYSVLFLGCPSLLPKTDEKQRTQLCFHFLSWIKNSENATDFEKELYSFALDYANKFHRADVERLEEMK